MILVFVWLNSLNSLGPSILLHMVLFHFFWWLSSVPLCMCTLSSLSIHLSVGIYVVSVSWLLWIVLQWTLGCMYLFKLVFSEHQEWDCKIIWHHLHLFDKDTFTTLYYKEVLMYVQCELITKLPNGQELSPTVRNILMKMWRKKKKKKPTCLKINVICWFISTVNPILKVKLLNYISQLPLQIYDLVSTNKMHSSRLWSRSDMKEWLDRGHPFCWRGWQKVFLRLIKLVKQDCFWEHCLDLLLQSV